MDITAGDIAIWSVAITSIAALVGIIVATVGGIKGILQIGKWVGNREGFEGSVSEAIKEMREDVKKIFSRLPAEPFFGTNSPLSLTDLGKVISKELNATVWAQENIQAIIKKGLTDDSPYGIQDFCFDYVKIEAGNLSEGMLGKVKQSAFDYGSGVDKLVVVLAICLRDELLAIYHPELSGMPDDPPTQ